MEEARDVLSLEKLDVNLDGGELVANARAMADFLENKQAPYPIAFVRPTLTYILEVDELISTHNKELQLELARALVYGFRLASATGSELPIDQEQGNLLFRLFRFLTEFFEPLKDKDCDMFKERANLLRIANEIGLFYLAKDTGLYSEIFNCLIEIDLPDATANLVKMINDCDRLPTPVVYGICDKIESQNPRIPNLLKNLQTVKQIEFAQSIRSFVSGEAAIELLSKVDDMLDIDPPTMFGYIESDLGNEDDPTRTAATLFAAKLLSKPDFRPDSWALYETVIGRHKDKLAKLRVAAVDFGFGVLKRLGEVEVDSVSDKSFDAEVFESSKRKIVDDVWEAAKQRIVDPATEVRVAVLKNMLHLDVSDIRMDFEYISIRLKDKSQEVRVRCLKLMLKLYESNPEQLDWLIESLIALYPTIKDIALYGFSCVMINHSLVEVAQQLNDRRPLLSLLNDTNEVRVNLPNYKEKAAREVLAKHIDLKTLDKVMKKVPKSFLEKALRPKDRKKVYEQLKKKIPQKLKEKVPGDVARLLMGLYQPCPLNTGEVMKCKNLAVVADLASVFADDFEVEVPGLLKNKTPTTLTILSKMGQVDLEDETRQQILDELVPLTAKKSKVRELALKAFAKLYRPAHKNLLKDITFAKDDTDLKIQFYARIGEVTQGLLKNMENEIPNYDKKTAKYALKLATLPDALSEHTIEIQLAALDDHPIEAFKSYLSVTRTRCSEWNGPEVFRTFAGVMQHSECEVRTQAIAVLSDAMNTTAGVPVQYLAFFALSATDPYEPNVAEAKRQLEAAIALRRDLLRKIGDYKPQIAPETAIQYLIHLLSHHIDFEKDLPELKTFAVYLRFFFAPLVADTTDIDFILTILFKLSCLDDIDEAYTDNMIKLCDLASVIVKELAGGRDWGTQQDISFEYSSRYYKETNSKVRMKQLLKQRQTDQIKSPKTKSKLLRAGMSPVLKSRGRVPATLPKLDDIDDDTVISPKKNKSAPSTPKRKSPRAPASATATPRRPAATRKMSPTTTRKSNK